MTFTDFHMVSSIFEPLCFLKWCPIFDVPCEHLWKSNQKIIFILLIFLLKSTTCWLTSTKLHHWGHTIIHNNKTKRVIQIFSNCLDSNMQSRIPKALFDKTNWGWNQEHLRNIPIFDCFSLEHSAFKTNTWKCPKTWHKTQASNLMKLLKKNYLCFSSVLQWHFKLLWRV